MSDLATGREHPFAPTAASACGGKKRPRSDTRSRSSEHNSGQQSQHDVDDCCPQQASAGDAVAETERRRGKLSSRRLPLGTFTGRTIYRNSLHPGERLSDGHVTLTNLIPPDCSSAFLTTFAGGDPAWMEQVFGGSREDAVEKLILVAHDCREGAGVARFVGDGEVVPILPQIRPHWYYVLARPHTSGCLHSKLLLFRSSLGLRVVVSGNNLFRGQWEVDRDCLWVQDWLLT